LNKFVIKGGNPLNGEVWVSGSKNAALPIIAASVLVDEPVILDNLPNISDVSVMLRSLEEMGADIRRIDKNSVRIDTTHLLNHSVSYEMATKIRGSYYFIGSLLGQYGEAFCFQPGGCTFCDRPMEQHIKAFEYLGAGCGFEEGFYSIKADKLIGSRIEFDKITVGGTINAVLAAVKAEGMTVITNAAKEPHVVDVASFLNSCGADVRGAGTDTIKVYGVNYLKGSNYSVIPDQIEAGTFLTAIVATKGDGIVRNVIPKHLESILKVLEKVGAEVEIFDEAIHIWVNEELNKTDIKTAPHPGFPTDMQPQISALLSVSNGTSLIMEDIWDHRFNYVDELRRMRANIKVEQSMAIVEGVEHLSGAKVTATDLRAGAALIIAGLCAKGTTEIANIDLIERGYEDIQSKLQGLNANIQKVYFPDEVDSAAAIA
jgi:UDP-N-acetylglucosamine 1-carboxyvinyltransferase